MSLSINLFNLIHSLSPHEKGYLKKQTANGDKSGKKYLILFEYLEQQQQYNEHGVKDHLKKAGFGGNLTNTKRYLLEMISQNLVNYQLKQNPKLEIAHYKQMAEVMMAKKQFALTKEYLDKAESIADTNELYTEQLIIANDRYRLAIRIGDYTFLENTFNLYQNLVKDRLQATDEMWQLIIAQSKTVAFSAKFGSANEAEVLEYFAQTMELPVFKTDRALYLVKHETMRLNVRSLYYKLQGNNKAAYQTAYDLVKLYQQTPEHIKRVPRNYMSALVTLANRSVLVKNYKLLTEMIGMMKALKENEQYNITSSLQLEISTYMFEMQLMHMHYTANFEQVNSLHHEIAQFVRLNKGGIKNENLVFFNYFLGYALFRIGEYESAYGLIKDLVDNYRDQAREDLLICSHFLLFVLHVAQGYTEMLPHTLNNVKYYLKNRQTKYQLVQPIVDYFGAIIKEQNDPAKKLLAKQQLLESIETYGANHTENALLEAFDIKWWAQQQ